MPSKENTLPVLHLCPGIPPVEVLYCDDVLLALSKPAGLLCVPDRFKCERPNLMKLIQDGIKKPAGWATEMKLTYAANAHRLDFDTSGVFILARTRAALSNLVRQFREREMKKSYIALVQGRLPASPMEINEPILPDPRFPGRAMISRRGRPSVSRAETIQNFRGLSLVRVWPETGRLHQVRIHMKSVGCPLVCDREYSPAASPLKLSEFKRRYNEGFEGEKPLLARQALHAESIELKHPTTGELIRIEAPLPRDLAVTIKQLTKYAAA
jgi:RluA family pseudouridine synthase